jgi:tryptophan synthase beta subunit
LYNPYVKRHKDILEVETMGKGAKLEDKAAPMARGSIYTLRGKRIILGLAKT